MKRIVTFLVIATSLAFVGCNKKEEVQTTLIDPQIGLEYKYPESWHTLMEKDIQGVYEGAELNVKEGDSLIATKISFEYDKSVVGKTGLENNLLSIYAIQNEEWEYFTSNGGSIDQITTLDNTKYDIETIEGDIKTFILAVPKFEALDKEQQSDKNYKKIYTDLSEVKENFKVVKSQPSDNPENK